jgi:hypothetical protein
MPGPNDWLQPQAAPTNTSEWIEQQRARQQANQQQRQQQGSAALQGFGARTADVQQANRQDFLAPGYQQRDDLYNQELGAALGGRMASGGEQWGQQQQQLANMLMGQASGQNSMSAEQLRQGQAMNVAAQQSMMAGARPGQGVAALRMGMGNVARSGYGLAGQQAMAGIAERQAAQQALAGVLGQARGQDMNASQFNASQQQQLAQALLGAQLQNAGMQQQGGQAYRGDMTTRYGIDQQVAMNAANQPSTGDKILGAVMGGAGLAAQVGSAYAGKP